MATLAEAISIAASRGLFVAFRGDPDDRAYLHVEVWSVPPPGSSFSSISERRRMSVDDFIAEDGRAIVTAIEAALAAYRSPS